MATQPQIQANRQNAQKSTGPRTPEGKAAVAQNALKHGLCARRDVVITESQADFDLHRSALLDELAPQGPMESILADRIVTLSWRLKRAEALGRIALKDFAGARVLDRLLMYERRIEHSLFKTTRELQSLQLLRDTLHASPNTLHASPLTLNAPPNTLHASPDTLHASRNTLHATENKPNSQNPKTTLTCFTTKDYENEPPQRTHENKPNSNRGKADPMHIGTQSPRPSRDETRLTHPPASSPDAQPAGASQK